MAEEEEEQPEPTHKDIAYGPYDRNRLDFWKADTDSPAPLVVNIHGGGFLMGEKAAGPVLLKWAAERGIAVAAIAYRFSQDAIAPASFTDTARAIQFLRHKAGEWGVDPTRVATIGPSAGAGLGMWTGVGGWGNFLTTARTGVMVVIMVGGPRIVIPVVGRGGDGMGLVGSGRRRERGRRRVG